jgi:dipeptidyl-peptidase 4
MKDPQRQKPWFWIFVTLHLAVVASVAAPRTLQAQITSPGPPSRPVVTRADYARAESLDRKGLAEKLKNGYVVPHWIAGTDEFWYRRETQAGYEFVVVNAADGGKKPAFDHAALAQALSQIAGEKFSPDKLPFDGFAFAPSRDAIRVEVRGKEYECRLQPVACIERKAAANSYVIRLGSPASPDATLPNSGVLVSPDGRWGVLSRDANLWLRDLENGKERALTKDGEQNCGYGIYPDGWKASYIPRERAVAAGHPLPPMESYWSPDSRTVIVTHVDQRHVAPYPYVETVPGDGSFRPKAHEVRVPLVGEKTAPLEWYAFDIPSGKYRKIEFPYDKLLVLQQDLLAIRKTWWSSDNRHLYAVAFGDNMESAFFFDADVSTGKVRTVIEEKMLPRMDLNSTSYNPPNVRVTKDGKEVIWFSERDGWGHLYLYDGETGKLENQITKGPWLVRDIINVEEAKRRIYFTGGGREGGNPYYRYLYRVNFDGSDLTLLSPEHADHSLTSPWNDVLAIDGAVGYEAISPSGKYVVYNYSTPQEPTKTVIRSTEDGKLVATFEKADATALFAAGYKPPEEFIAKSADGSSDLWCLLYKPSNFDPSKKYPVIDLEYASPLTAVVPRTFGMGIAGPSEPSSPSAFAELGFIAVVVDGRGTTFRSREFSQANYGKLNINGLDDHVAAIQQLAARNSWIDIDRVGVTGRSYGGWSSFRAMLEFPDFYKAGVAGAPPGSMQSQYVDYHWSAFQGRPVYSDGSELRPAPNEVPKNYNALDGRQQASRLKGRLLVIMGELDENVLPGSTLQFLDALQHANKDFDLIYLANQNHYFTGNPYVTRRVWDFFVRNLLGAEPPEWNPFPPAPSAGTH